MSIEGREVAAIESGLVVLAGVAEGDGPEDADHMAAKIANLRIFERDGRMDLSVRDVGGGVLLISQFTLYADTRKGRRPSFTAAARPEQAEPLLERLAQGLRSEGLDVQTGRFGAMMRVQLVNDGPVTIILDSADRLIPRRQS